MSKYKTLVIVALVVILGGIGLAAWDALRTTAPNPDIPDEQAVNPDHMVGTNVSFIVTEGEVKKWKVDAKQATYNESRTEATMTDIVGEFYDEAGQPVLTFTAPAGEYVSQNNKIVLTGGVVVTATDEDGGEMHAPTMNWDAKSPHINASGGVKMIFPQGVSRADRCRFSLDFSYVALEGNAATEVQQ